MFNRLFNRLFKGFLSEPAAPVVAGQVICTAPDPGPWRVEEWMNTDSLVLQSDTLAHGAALVITGNFDSSAERLAYANAMASWLNDQVQACTSVSGPAAPAQDAEPDMDNMPWEPEDHALPPHMMVQRRKQLAGGAAAPSTAPSRGPAIEPTLDVELPVAAPRRAPVIPIRPVSVGRVDKPFGAYGCHCELAPGQAPDACAIDQGFRQSCTLAQDGRERNTCEFWQPVGERRVA